MKDVLVDQRGDFRCPHCHGKNFQHKRTLRGKVAAGVVVLPAALLVPKRMKCLQCGEYSKTGSATAWRDPELSHSPGSSPAVRPIEAAGDAATAVSLVLTATSNSLDGTRAALRELFPHLSLHQQERTASTLARGEPVEVLRIDQNLADVVLARVRKAGFSAAIRDDSD